MREDGTMEKEDSRTTAFDEMETRYERIGRLRLVAVIVYVSISLLLLGYYFVGDIENDTYVGLYLGYTVFGSAILFYAYLYPLFRPRNDPVPSGSMTIPPQDVDLSVDWREILVTRNLLYLFPPVLILITLWAILIPHPVNSFRVVLVSIVMMVLGSIFGKLEVRCSRTHLSFHYGPLGRDVPIGKIESIRAISLKGGRDYLGNGIDLAPDGSIGYIADGKTGVLISMLEGRNYRLTVSDPQSLVDYVRAAMDGHR